MTSDRARPVSRESRPLALSEWQFAVSDNRWRQIAGPGLEMVSLCQKWTQRGAPCEGEGGCQLIVLERGGRGFMSEAILADCVFFFSSRHHHTFIFVPLLFQLLLLCLLLFVLITVIIIISFLPLLVSP